MRPSTLRAVVLALSAMLVPACVADDETTSLPEPIDDPGLDLGDVVELEPDTQPELPQARKIVEHDYQVQQTGYWCGPAATRIALSARITPPTQQALANQLPTTTNGTDWIGQITRTLNDRLGGKYYVTVEMPNDPPTAAQRDRLWQDVLRSLDADFPVVANIVAPPGNQPPGYPSNQTIYHYFTVVGYDREKREVYIADPANFGGYKHYWLTLDKLASLIPPKGYSTLAPPTE